MGSLSVTNFSASRSPAACPACNLAQPATIPATTLAQPVMHLLVPRDVCCKAATHSSGKSAHTAPDGQPVMTPEEEAAYEQFLAQRRTERREQIRKASRRANFDPLASVAGQTASPVVAAPDGVLPPAKAAAGTAANGISAASNSSLSLSVSPSPASQQPREPATKPAAASRQAVLTATTSSTAGSSRSKTVAVAGRAGVIRQSGRPLVRKRSAGPARPGGARLRSAASEAEEDDDDELDIEFLQDDDSDDDDDIDDDDDDLDIEQLAKIADQLAGSKSSMASSSSSSSTANKSSSSSSLKKPLPVAARTTMPGKQSLAVKPSASAQRAGNPNALDNLDVSRLRPDLAQALQDDADEDELDWDALEAYESYEKHVEQAAKERAQEEARKKLRTSTSTAVSTGNTSAISADSSAGAAVQPAVTASAKQQPKLPAANPPTTSKKYSTVVLAKGTTPSSSAVQPATSTTASTSTSSPATTSTSAAPAPAAADPSKPPASSAQEKHVVAKPTTSGPAAQTAPHQASLASQLSPPTQSTSSIATTTLQNPPPAKPLAKAGSSGSSQAASSKSSSTAKAKPLSKLDELEELLKFFELAEKANQQPKKGAVLTTTGLAKTGGTASEAPTDEEVDWALLERLLLGDKLDKDVQALSESVKQVAGSSPADDDDEKEADPWADDITNLLLGLLLTSHKRYVESALLPNEPSEDDRAGVLWDAPFALMVHDNSSQASLEYANKAALQLMQCDFLDIYEKTSFDFIADDDEAQQEWLWATQEAADSYAHHSRLPRLMMKGAQGQQFIAKDVLIWRVDSLEGGAIGQAFIIKDWQLVKS